MIPTEIKTWELYFPAEEYTIFNREIQLIIEILSNLKLADVKESKNSGIFFCEYSFYLRYQSIKCINCAVSEIFYSVYKEYIQIETRIVNYMNSVNKGDADTGNDSTTHGSNPFNSIYFPFGSISIDIVGSMICIKGTVCRVGYKKIENLEIFFECTKCNRITKQILTNNIYKVPSSCTCRNKQLIFINNHSEMKSVDRQEIKLQELHSTDKPRTVDVDLFGSFVGVCTPGDVISVIGIVKAELIDGHYQLRIECNNMHSEKSYCNQSMIYTDKSANDTPISSNSHTQFINSLVMPYTVTSEFNMLKQISEELNLLGLFVNNLYKNIYGNDIIKVGLILSLFGGTRKVVGQSHCRSEIHVLIVGDPGLGKSKMLLSSVGIIPKSTYISGNSTTTVGLTISITHDPANGEYMADAGALVISDGGICCIDEFDKINDHTALFEAMEDQCVTVAKGGVICSVPTRTTIIAASNPKSGHFDSSKSIRDNLRFDSALLSRFDLIYILKDDLSAKENYEISNQILKKRLLSYDCSSNSDCSKSNSRLANLIQNSRHSAKNLFKINNREINPETLHKYIEYARSSINPILSKAAKNKIMDYYLEIRKNTGISIRNLESLIRLTEAVAKMELKSVASEEHAQFAIKLYREVLIKEENKTNTKANIEELLKDFIVENSRNTIGVDELERIIIEKMKKSPKEMIDVLNYKGIILKVGKSGYKINL